jgi:signal transduction histidine kinase
VDVKAHGKVVVNDRLAAELFQIVTEGLSNVRRHALCDDACVEITCNEGRLLLEIKNRRRRISGNLNFGNDDNSEGHVSFTPYSISQRVALLGGETRVSVDEKNYTVVSVGIPL